MSRCIDVNEGGGGGGGGKYVSGEEVTGWSLKCEVIYHTRRLWTNVHATLEDKQGLLTSI